MTSRQLLLANALFCTVSALALLLLRERLAPLFALSSPALLLPLGAGLVIYGLMLALVVVRRPPGRQTLLTAASLDLAWVFGSVLVLLLAWSELAPAGRMLIIAVALVVDLFAALQWRQARWTEAR